MQNQGQGHAIYPSIHVCYISPEPFERFSINFTQIFQLKGCLVELSIFEILKEQSRSYDPDQMQYAAACNIGMHSLYVPPKEGAMRSAVAQC